MAVRTRTGGDWTVTSTDDTTGQEAKVLDVVRVSFDDVGTPWHERTWVAIDTDRIESWEIEGGRASELDEVDATTARYTVEDTDRDLDPTNPDSPHAPDVVPNRLLWHQAQTLSATYDVFVGYVDAWGPTWNERIVGAQRAVIRCTDGRKILNRRSLESVSPNVAEYDELVDAFDPSFYYRMGEPQGTKLVGHSRVIRYKKGEKKGKRKRVKRWKTRETRAATTGVSGPSGTYRNTPILGEPGAIMGDPDTAMRVREAASERADISVGVNDFRGLTGLTVACWAKPTAGGTPGLYVAGPVNATHATSIFELGTDINSNWYFLALTPAGVARVATGFPASASVWAHVVGVWDGTFIQLYVDGVNFAGASLADIADGTAGILSIGGTTVGLTPDATIDEVAIYEKALTQPQIQALYAGAALGFPSMSTGTRVGSVLDLVDEFPVWNIHAGTRTMPPTRYAGLPPAQLIDEAEDGEGLPAIFRFSKAGVPTLLPADYRDNPPFDTALYTFSTHGLDGIPFATFTITDQDSFLFNIIEATPAGGDETFTAADATSIDRYGPLPLPIDDLPLTDAVELQAYADTLLARYKDPLVRIDSFTISGADDTALDALLTLDQQDCVQVQAQPPGGGDPIDQTSYVERRRLWREPGANPIMGRFAISPR